MRGRVSPATIISSEVLPAPEGPHKASTRPGRFNARLDIEGAKRMGDVDFDHKSPARLETRAARTSEAIRAPNAMAIATSVRRSTLVSAPGCCV